VEFIEIQAGANVPPVIDDRYPYLQGTFLIFEDGTASLINHKKSFKKVPIDYWKDYSEVKPAMSFKIDWFHFLVDSPESVSLAMPFFQMHLSQRMRPLFFESSLQGQLHELAILASHNVLDQGEYEEKKSQIYKYWSGKS